MSDIITPSGLPIELLTITNDNTLIEVYNPDTGQNEKTKVSTLANYVNVGSVVTGWSDLVTYSTQGTLVDLDGMIFSSTGEAGNLDKDPTDTNNALYWYQPEDKVSLLGFANRGKVIEGEMHDIHDRASLNYAQNMLISQQNINGTQKEFHLIHLDGSVVTGDTTLEALFGIGGDLNPYIDIFAPDFAGTRTLIDMGEYITTPQSFGGENDVMGDLQDDRGQAWQLGANEDDSGSRDYWGVSAARDVRASRTGVSNITVLDLSTTGQGSLTKIIAKNDGTNGDIRQGLTNRPKELTAGASYIVVVQVA